MFTVRQPIEENKMRGKPPIGKKGDGFRMPEKMNAGESETMKTGSKDNRWELRRTKITHQARTRKEDRNLYGRRKRARGTSVLDSGRHLHALSVKC